MHSCASKLDSDLNGALDMCTSTQKNKLQCDIGNSPLSDSDEDFNMYIHICR